MGDVLSLAVMFDPLLQRFPGARLVVWCHSRNAEMFQNDPRIARTHTAPFPWSARGSKRGSLSAWFAVLRSGLAARALRPNAAIDPRGDIRSQAMMLLSGAPRRIGYTTYVASNLELRGLLLTAPLAGPALPHRFDMNLNTLTPLLGSAPALTLPALRVDPTPATPTGTAPRTILIHRGAGWLYRRWELARWIELVERLQALPGMRVAQIAGPGELELAQELSASLATPIETFATTFEGMKSQLAAATVFVGLDSGPMNAASLLNVPSVALFGPGVAPMWRPRGRDSLFLQHIENYPCHPCTQIVCVRPEDPCMTTITVAEVFDAVTSILAAA